MNVIRVKVSEEAIRLSRHREVDSIEQVIVSTLDYYQLFPKWALDRIDEQYPTTPDEYPSAIADSNYGTEIDSWAPAEFIQMLSDDNVSYCDPANCGYSGTSFAAPLVAGTAAIACEAFSPDCSTVSVPTLFGIFKAAGSSTVLEQDGTALPAGHPDIVIWQQW